MIHRIFIVGFLAVAPSFAGAVPLEVKVAGVNATKGALVLRVFQSEGDWLKSDKAIGTQKLSPGAATLVARFDLSPGSYAVHVFQDENDNGKLDMKWLPPGPAEPWVVSNNAQGTMGPPSFKDSKIELAGPQTLNLSLQGG